MANKPRPPMTKAEDIIEWAVKTQEANGEAFTMLNKEEQLLIARFILAMRNHIKMLQGEDKEKNPAPEKEEPPKKEVAPEKETMPEADGQEEILVRETEADKRQSNMEFFKANSVGMQRAYQLFLTWQGCDPTNRTILDESRKAYVNSAAFAFWLNLPHE